MTSDSNSNALDSGIECSLTICEKVDPKLVISITETIVKNVADKCFSSRPTTQTKGKQLIHKLMEINDPHPATSALIEKFNDKKPKVPPLCIETIVEGISLFGAACFPLKDLLKAIQPAFNSSNNAVRDNALSLVTVLIKWIGAAPIHPMMENLRPAQRSEIEKFISEHDVSERPVPSLFLRKDRAAGLAAAAAGPQQRSKSAVDTMDLIEEVDLIKKLKSSDYEQLMKSDKWVEQSQGLQLIIDAIGPTPKLKPVANIQDIVKACKEYLQTGHLQVQAKSLKLLTLFGLGLRTKFAVDGRSIMSFVLMKAKEKKVVDDVEETCITLFKNCFGMDPFAEDIAESLKNKKTPTHAKICVQRIVKEVMSSETVTLQPDHVRMLIEAIAFCAEDSDPKVRESTIAVLSAIHHASAHGSSATSREIASATGQLQASNARLFAKFSAADAGQSAANDAPTKPAASTVAAKSTMKAAAKPASSSAGTTSALSRTTTASSGVSASTDGGKGGSKKAVGKASKEERLTETIPVGFSFVEMMNFSSERIDASLVSLLGEEKDNFANLLNDAKWQSKVEALTLACTKISSCEDVDEEAANALFLFVAAQTSNFKINNINVTKSIVEVGAALMKKSKSANKPLVCALIDSFGDKFSDKKMVPAMEDMAHSAVQMVGLNNVLDRLNAIMEPVKAPLAHTNYLAWAKAEVHNVGVGGVQLNVILRFFVKELENKQGTIRSASIEVLAEFYRHIGPPFFVAMNQYDISAPLRSTLEAECNKIGYDPSLAAKAVESGGSSSQSMVPRADLSTIVDKNILSDMGTVEGKDSWQIRKVAIERIIAACDSSANYVEMNKFIAEVIKALKLRLNDTQSNLRPLAVSAIAKIVVSLEDDAAVKVIKACCAPILGCLSDNKKVIKDAGLAALESIVSHSPPSKHLFFAAMIPTFAEWLHTSPAKSDLLVWMNGHLDGMEGDASEMIPALVESLQDKNSLTRSSAENILGHFLQTAAITAQGIDKITRDLSPAAKKFIQPFLDRILVRAPAQRVATASVPTAAPAVTSIGASQTATVAHASEARAPVSTVRAENTAAAKAESLPAPKLAEAEVTAEMWPSYAPGSKTVRVKQYSYADASVDRQLLELRVDWFYGEPFGAAKMLFGLNVSPIDGIRQCVSFVQDERFIHQSDFVFRWIGLQILALQQQNAELENFLHLCTLLMDGIRSLPRVVKQQLDPSEVSYFLPHLLGICRNLTDLQRQNCNAIVNCTSDCFPAHAISEHLLKGLDSGFVDCRRLCLNEILRLTESVGFSALGRNGMRVLLQLLSKVSKGDPMFPFYQRLAASLLESVDYDVQKLRESYGDEFDVGTLQKFVTTTLESVVETPSPSLTTKLTLEHLFHLVSELLVLADPRNCAEKAMSDLVLYAEQTSEYFVGEEIGVGDLIECLQQLTSLVERVASLESSATLSIPAVVLLSSTIIIVQHLVQRCAEYLDPQNIHKLLADVLESSRKLLGNPRAESLRHSINAVAVQILYSVNSLHAFESLMSLSMSSAWLRKPLLRILRNIVEHKSYKVARNRSLDELLKIVEGCEKLVSSSSIMASSTIEANTLMIRLIYRALRDIYGESILVEILEQTAHTTRHLLESTAISSSSLSTSQEQGENASPNVTMASFPHSPDGKVIALVNEITSSRDKSQCIQELYKLKVDNPSLDVEKYLEKLSSTFRKFVLDEFVKLESSNSVSSEYTSVSEPGHDDSFHWDRHSSSEQATEALRIIENLKSITKPAVSISQDEDFTDLENGDGLGGLPGR